MPAKFLCRIILYRIKFSISPRTKPGTPYIFYFFVSFSVLLGTGLLGTGLTGICNVSFAAEQTQQHTSANNQISQEALIQNKELILAQLTDTLHHMASLMDKHEMMNHTQLQKVAMAINQLSLNLHELSQKMQDSQLDTQSLATLKKKNAQLKQEMEELLLQFNDN